MNLWLELEVIHLVAVLLLLLNNNLLLRGLHVSLVARTQVATCTLATEDILWTSPYWLLDPVAIQSMDVMAHNNNL